MKKFIFMAILASMFVGCESANKVDNSTVATLDLNRYLGYWYEIARYDHAFERGIYYSMARYTMRDDGKIDVVSLFKTNATSLLIPGNLLVSLILILPTLFSNKVSKLISITYISSFVSDGCTCPNRPTILPETFI